MSNRFIDKFQVRYPLCSAGMAMIATPVLVAAVSNAGGIGVLGTGPVPPQWLQAAIHEVRSHTSNPFAVNLINEVTAFGPLTTAEHVAVCAEEAVDLVVFFWQLPERAWIETLERAGVSCLVTVGSIEAIRGALELPVSGLMLQGTEAGGHIRSDAPLEDLLRYARSSHPDVMLIGAGGIASAEDIRVALDWGADAVCMGTRFVASVEANAHPEYQRRIVAARASDTVVTDIFGPEWPGVPMRVIANKATRGDATTEPIGVTELFGQTYELPPNSAVLPMRATTGDFDRMCLAAGNSVERIENVRPAAEIVADLFRGWWR